MTIIGTAEIAVTADARQFGADVESQVGSVAKKAGALLAAAFAVDKVTDFAKASISAASDLEESTSKVGVVFGAAKAEILAFGEQSATSVGLARQEALEAAGTFGNLFTALGLSKDAAADMAPEVVQLAADLASFNNLGVPETLDKLRSGLVGEIEPLRSLGISFDAATVEAKALELGLAGVDGQIGESAKVQARLALIMEQTTAAQGDFARTSGGLANQQRILSAEWKNAQAAIGQALLPTVLELVQVGRQDLIPFIERAAKSSVPLFTSAIRAGVPIAESLMTVFETGLPVLEGFARTVEAIPAPVLSTVASIAAMRSALGPLPGLLRSVTGPAGLAGLATPTGAAALGLGLLVTAVGLHSQAREAERQRIEEVTKALEDNTQTMEENLTSIVEEKFAAFNEELAAAGVNTDQLTEAIAAGGDAFDQYSQQIADISDNSTTLSEVHDKLRDDLRDLRDEIIAGAEEAVRNKVATGEMSQAYADLAIQVATTAEGEVNWVAALAEAETQQRATAGELNRFQTATDLAAEKTTVLGEAFQTAQEEADSFKTAIDELIKPMLAQENATIKAAEAAIEFAKELKEGREENESQEEFMLRIAGSTNELIEAQLGAAGSSREAAERLIELGRRFPEVKGKVDELVTRMQFAGQEVGPAGRMIAQAFVDGIVNGLRDGEGRISQSADTVARIIETRVSRRLQVESPSKVAIRIGREFVRGLAIGLEGAGIVDSALDRLGSAFDRFAGSVRGLPNLSDALADVDPETTLQGFLLGAQETQNTSAAFLANIDRLVAAGADDLAAAFLEQGIDAAGLVQQAVDAIATGQLSAFEAWFERLESQTADLSKRSAQILIEQFDESGRQGGFALGEGIASGLAEVEDQVIRQAYELAARAGQAVTAAVGRGTAGLLPAITATPRPSASDIFAIPERNFPIPGARDIFAIPEMPMAKSPVTITGPVTVVANNPEELVDQLTGRKIRAAVTIA